MDVLDGRVRYRVDVVIVTELFRCFLAKRRRHQLVQRDRCRQIAVILLYFI